jgi:hypothetical protein
MGSLSTRSFGIIMLLLALVATAPGISVQVVEWVRQLDAINPSQSFSTFG